MFCPFCGKQNRDGKKFCRQCGKLVPPPRVRIAQPRSSFLPLPAEPSTRSDEEDQKLEGLLGNFLLPVDPNLPYRSVSDQKQRINDTTSKRNVDLNPAARELDDYLNEPTGQLLPDTVDLQPPNVQQPNLLPHVGGNGIEKPANGAAAFLSLRSQDAENSLLETGKDSWQSKKPGSGSTGNGSPADLQLSNDTDEPSGDFTSTDELELDKTLDRTIETPLISPSSPAAEDKSLELSFLSPASNSQEPLSERNARPLFSFMSQGLGQNSLMDRSLRVERIALFVAVAAALAGFAILLWLLLLKPQVG
jgi:hypothetical protein